MQIAIAGFFQERSGISTHFNQSANRKFKIGKQVTGLIQPHLPESIAILIPE